MICHHCQINPTIAPNYNSCTACINARHRQLRGSNALLFTRGTREATCQQGCGCGLNHLCQLRAAHGADGIGHYYSSECSETGGLV